MTENLYCKIFVDTIEEYNDFFEIVEKFLNGHKQAVSFIGCNWCSLDVRRNKEYILQSPDFLYWKFMLNVDPTENISEDTYKNNIIKLVAFLKRHGRVVCACDFEELFNR